MSDPTCIIIGGPNGAGKTTFALTYLPEVHCLNFINVDLIGTGLSPLSLEKGLIRSSKLFLHELKGYIQRREDFAFETTLSGRVHLKLIKQILANGWKVILYYLWLPSIEASITRIAERVAHGGHDIPQEAIVRRYPRSIRNLLYKYAPLCTSTICLDNSSKEPTVIFMQDKSERRIVSQELYSALLKGAEL